MIFASSGDNITPPYEALGWIPVLYPSTQALKAAEQRLIYLLNPHVGHLGIFVSVKVARFEHRAILESVDELEALAPGLYEMKILNPTGDPDCRKPQYFVAFEERRVEDLRRYAPHGKAFARLWAVSEVNEALYRDLVSPWVRAAITPWSAELLRWLHPMRLSRYLFSERFNPWMGTVAGLAVLAHRSRRPVPDDHPLRQIEREFSTGISTVLAAFRQQRDETFEHAFRLLYGAGSPDR